MSTAEVLKTAALYISRFLGVRANVYEWNEAFRSGPIWALENPAAEKKIFCIIKEAADYSVYYLKSDYTSEYCLAFWDDCFLMIGPYRTKAFQKNQALRSKEVKRDQLDALMQTYNMLPLVSENDIEMAVKIPFVGMNHTSITEYHIELREPVSDPVEGSEAEKSLVNVDIAAIRIMESMSLLSLLCEGNYPEVLNRFDAIMRTKQHPFSYVNVIEGLTTLRVLISIALNAMSVPPRRSYLLLREFKLKARAVATKEDARNIAVDVLIKACQMIQEQSGLKYSDVIRTAISYISSHLSQPITIAEIALEVHMTSSSFARKFRNELQMTPTEYIIRERMHTAADLLVFTSYDIKQICFQVGILDANYFARCFKKEYGVPPTEYRKMRQNGG